MGLASGPPGDLPGGLPCSGSGGGHVLCPGFRPPTGALVRLPLEASVTTLHQSYGCTANDTMQQKKEEKKETKKRLKNENSDPTIAMEKMQLLIHGKNGRRRF